MSEIARKQTRRRNALSCVDCRRRKEKCDRRLPCGSCAARRGAVCCYDPPKRPSVLSQDAWEASKLSFALWQSSPPVDQGLVRTIAQPLPIFSNTAGSKWLTGVAHPPLTTYLTPACALTSIEAVKGMNNSREYIWRTGNVVGMVSHRISHLSACRSLPEDVAEAIALLEQIELFDDSVDAVAEHVESLQALVTKGKGMKAYRLDGLMNGIMLVSAGVLSVVLRKPLSAPPRAGFDRPFDSRLLSSSPLSVFAFSRCSYLLRLEDDIVALLATMKELTLQCVRRRKTYSGFVDDDSGALLQCQPDGVREVVFNAAEIYEHAIVNTVPFAHHSHESSRKRLIASMLNIRDLDEAFRYMPGVLVWALVVANAAAGQDITERRFLLPSLQRWCVALGFCTDSAHVLDILSTFAGVEIYINSTPSSGKSPNM